MNPAGYPSFDSSFALIKEPENINVNMTDEEDKMMLAASRISVAIQKKPFRISVYRGDGTLLVSEGARGMGFNEKKEVICYKEMDHEDHFYGFGEKSGFLNKRGEKMTMWNTDVYALTILKQIHSINRFLFLRHCEMEGRMEYSLIIRLNLLLT